MPVLFQICVEGNTGSTGRIAESIGKFVISQGWTSYIAHGRFPRPSESRIIKIGNHFDILIHGLLTRLADMHGFGSKRATRKLIEQIDKIKPDIIQLHHLHGYYINIELLFNYLSSVQVPVIWIFHDCWSMTGHCAHFEYIDCHKWKTFCHDCPQKCNYPTSFFLDRSRKNYQKKKELFTRLSRMTIVPVSFWLEKIVSESFLRNSSTKTIQNGINTSVFTPAVNTLVREKLNVGNKFIILGVASPWTRLKGLYDFMKLSDMLSEKEVIIMVGLDRSQIRRMPDRIIALEKTERRQELIELYSVADVFFNPTWEDTFPTTNIEALSCGTPVITYKTGGSVEAISDETGYAIEKGDLNGLRIALDNIRLKGKTAYSEACRGRAVSLFNENDMIRKYFDLFKTMMNSNKID